MDQLVSGEVCGLTWYEIPRAAGGWGERKLDPDIKVITVLAPLGKFPGEHSMNMLRLNPAGISLAVSVFPFKPFDVAKELPGRAVMYAYNDFTDANIDAWAKANTEIPEELELTFSISTTRHAIYVSAATVRKGRLVHIRRRLDVEKVFADALAEHISYFLRNCPRPVGDIGEFTCGRHVAAILAALPGRSAVAVVEAWLDRHRQAPERGVAALTLLPEFLPGTEILRMTLDMFADTNAVKASITLVGGHQIEDDETGVEVSLRATLPDTVARALKGRPLSDAVDASWASDMSIRLVRDQKPGADTVHMKAGVGSVPLALPTYAPQDEAEADREVIAMTTGENPRWRLIEATAIPVMSRLDRADLAIVLYRLVVEQNVDLGPYGQPGWLMRGRGAEIIVDKCPTEGADGLLALLAAERD